MYKKRRSKTRKGVRKSATHKGATRVSSRKPKRKSSRKPARKSSRKPARKSSRKPARKSSRKPARKSSRKPARKGARVRMGFPADNYGLDPSKYTVPPGSEYATNIHHLFSRVINVIEGLIDYYIKQEKGLNITEDIISAIVMLVKHNTINNFSEPNIIVEDEQNQGKVLADVLEENLDENKIRDKVIEKLKNAGINGRPYRIGRPDLGPPDVQHIDVYQDPGFA
jgi:hypothetical protein